jgi:hypothetical protein
MGILYDFSIWYLVAFSVAFQLMSVPFFVLLRGDEGLHYKRKIGD